MVYNTTTPIHYKTIIDGCVFLRLPLMLRGLNRESPKIETLFFPSRGVIMQIAGWCNNICFLFTIQKRNRSERKLVVKSPLSSLLLFFHISLRQFASLPCFYLCTHMTDSTSITYYITLFPHCLSVILLYLLVIENEQQKQTNAIIAE